VNSDANLGDLSNVVVLSGGALQSAIPLLRTVSITGAGGTINVPSNTVQSDVNALNSTATFTKVGAGTLNFLNASSSAGTLSVSSGTLLFHGGLAQQVGSNLASGTFIVGAGAMLDITGSDILSNSAAVTLDGVGASFPRLTSMTSNAGRLTLTNGSVFATRGNVANSGTVTVSGTSILRVHGNLTSTATVDLNNAAAILDYDVTSPLSALRTQIASAYSNGAWTGPGIGSSLAAANASTPHKTALGYAEQTAIGLTAYQGQTLDTTSILIRYTLSGDMNLDGMVNSTDFTMLAMNYNAINSTWSAGDVNYDGTVNALDFNSLASNYGAPLLAAPIGALVPEPFCLTLLPLALFARRRRLTPRRGS
jgi:autotransporter-associated beta strand protein